MKKFFLFAIALMSVINMNAQEVCAFNADNAMGLDSENGTALTAGQILGETASIVAKVGADDSYKPQSATFTVNGQGITGGLQGATNPKDADGGVPATTLVQPAGGAFLVFEAKADGFLYVLHKALSNKAYTVFEEGVAISYTFTAIGSADSDLGAVYSFTLPYEVENEQFVVKNPIEWAEQEFLKVSAPTKYAARWSKNDEGVDVWDPIKVNGLGVIKFPVYVGCKYIVNANGSKITSTGFVFSKTDNVTIKSGRVTIYSGNVSKIGEEFDTNGIRYRISGENTVSVVSRNPEYSGDVVIPSQVIYNGANYSVKSIVYDAFRNCRGLTSITIPPSVTWIGEDAFEGCNSLTSVHISDLEAWLNITFYEGIINETHSSNPLRQARHLYLNGVEVKELKIPNSITNIKYATFAGCSGLTSITIPNSVKAIGCCAFQECSGLNSISIPNSVTSIDMWAFLYCSGLNSVSIPNSVTNIGWGAFQECNKLTTIVSEIENPFAIDEGVFPPSVYNSASLLVPLGKKSAYQNTPGWKKFQNIVETSVIGKEFEVNGIRYLIGENNTVSVTSKPEKYTGYVSIPNQVNYNGTNYSVTSIGSSAFEGCIDMTSVSIPSSVTTIGGAAFYYCTGLKTVDIPNGVRIIGEGAFSKCGGLTSVTIPGSVTSIGKNAFFQCYGLTQISSGIESPFAIDDGVFPSGVYNSASLIVPFGTKSSYQNTSGWKRFQNIVEASVVGKEFEANGIRYKIGENNTVSVTSKPEKYTGAVSIPSQVNYNGTNYSVTSIGSSAFEGCIDMTSVSIPSSVTTIGGAAFYYCTGLTTVDIPDGVKTIGEGAFSKCGGLTSVSIPGSVTSIGNNAFFQCYGLTKITSMIENPFAIDDGVFPTSVYNNASLFIPSGKKSAYQNTAGWKRFQNIYYADGIYTLTYYVDGVEYKSVTYSYGAGITPEPAPTKEGYTFSGWIDLPETMPNHDVTVTGTFTLNKYKLTYKVDGEVYQTYLIEYGATITPEAEPTKEGYTFSGWSYIPEKMPADEVTIVGSFTINQYTITYMIDGEKYASETVDYNSKIVPPTPPSKDGFDFAWEEYPELMPAHDITINGAYTTTGILSIAVESGKTKIFTLDGRQVDTPQKGINIIRMDDGTIKKVVLK